LNAISLTKKYYCKVCKAPFKKERLKQKICGETACIVETVYRSKAKRERLDRAETKVKLEAIKPRAKFMAEAQAIANRYARIRDVNDGCISCDKPSTWGGQWHGSHFRSVGAASAVRLNLWNIHKACSICNNHLSGNIAAYAPRIVVKIGAERVEWLQSQNQLVRHDVDYLKKYKRVIGKRLKRMEKKHAL
jgi:Bacteriophage Lambda NinG protein